MGHTMQIWKPFKPRGNCHLRSEKQTGIIQGHVCVENTYSFSMQEIEKYCAIIRHALVRVARGKVGYFLELIQIS